MSCSPRLWHLEAGGVARVPADDPELYGIAETLPVGRIFASGKAFVPFVARAAFDKLRALVEGGVISDPRAPTEGFADQPSAEMFTADAISSADALWSKIEVGTTVLAAQPDLYGPGWWEGIVVGVDGDGLTIRWVDEAALEPIHVSPRHVALRHPGADRSAERTPAAAGPSSGPRTTPARRRQMIQPAPTGQSQHPELR